MSSKELRAAGNVVRHVNSLQVDENGGATYEAFTLDVTKETGLSVSKLDSGKFDEKEQQLVEVRLVLSRSREMKPSHGLAELNVGTTKELVFNQSGTLRFRIRFISDPFQTTQYTL